jgi:hypothetical protein
VFFFENGVTSVNLPVASQVIGSRATRSTHPKVLKGMSRFFEALFGEEFIIRNPFELKTKTDLFKGLLAAGAGGLIPHSVSCVKTMQSTTEHPHCGLCSQCVDRFLSGLAAGMTDNEDPRTGYAIDMVTAQRSGADAIQLEEYVRSARQFAKTTEALQLVQEYGELGAVIRNMDMTAAEAAEKMCQLHHRHGVQICEGFERIIAMKTEDIAMVNYPQNSLLAAVCGGTPTAPQRHSVEVPASPGLIVDRDQFMVRQGGKECFLGSTKEFWFINLLFQKPGRFIRNEEIIDAVWDGIGDYNAVQQAVWNLRRKLRQKGIENCIDGDQPGHYRLLPEAAPRPRRIRSPRPKQDMSAARSRA